MKFGYAIIYVDDVAVAVKFYGEAFGLGTQFVHEGGDYAEQNTGETTLAFADHSLGELNFPNGYTWLSGVPSPPGMEIAFVTDNVTAAVTKAKQSGATVIAEPTQKPWGQTVANVRSPDGTVIELCTPVAG